MSPSLTQSCDISSDSEFDHQSKVIRRRKRKTKLDCEIEDISIKSQNWEELPADIQSVLPHDAEYSYVIQSYQKQDTESFEGAPEFAFTAVIRINLETPDGISTWLKKMMETSLCTYRVTRGGHKPVGKRLLCKHEMHCQHFRKPLTPVQIQRSATAKAKKQKKPLCTRVRDKKTQCPSKLTLSLQVPTEKQKRAQPYLLTHKAVLKLDFIHNHPIHAAHTLSFRPVSQSTKQKFLSFLTKDTVLHLPDTHMSKCLSLIQNQMLTNKYY